MGRRVLLTSIVVALLSASPASAFVYWGETNMGRSNLDGTGVNLSFLPAADVDGGLAVDGNHIYWGAIDTIARSNLDGSDLNMNFIVLSRNPEAVTVTGDHIYWTEDGSTPSNGTIGRAALDGSNVTQGLITNQADPNGIAADGQHIYWTTSSGTISRAGTDGSNVQASFIANTDNARGLAVDAGHLYWAAVAGPGVGRANVDGTGANPTFVTTASGPHLVAVDSTHVYWTPTGPGNAIGRANLDGTAVEQSFISNAGVSFGLGVDPGPPGSASASTQSLSFGTQATDTLGTPQTVTVTNGGHGQLQLGPAQVTGSDPDDFLISLDTCTGALLDPGATCALHVRFGPTATGARSATLSLGSLQIGLSGTGGPLPQGPPGKIELVTCRTVTVKVKRHHKVRHVKRKKCTAKLVSGPVKFRTS